MINVKVSALLRGGTTVPLILFQTSLLLSKRKVINILLSWYSNQPCSKWLFFHWLVFHRGQTSRRIHAALVSDCRRPWSLTSPVESQERNLLKGAPLCEISYLNVTYYSVTSLRTSRLRRVLRIPLYSLAAFVCQCPLRMHSSEQRWICCELK